MNEITQADRDALAAEIGHEDQYPSGAFALLEPALRAVAKVREERAVSKWQPIETAPDNRLLILFFPPTDYRRGKPMLGEMYRVEKYPVHYPRQPTHWMPLPPSPLDSPRLAAEEGGEK